MKKRIEKEVKRWLRAYPQLPKSGKTPEARWQRLISEALGEMEPPKRRLCELRFFRRVSRSAVEGAVPVSPNTYDMYQKDIIACVAIKAAGAGLLEP